MPSVEPIETEAIEVVYEKGVLRPVHPLDLAEGTRLEVTLTEIVASHANATESEHAEIDEAVYTAFLSKLENIAALPLQSESQQHTARDHDAILYPKQGIMP